MPLPDNEKVNIEFVIAVGEYPVLYNYNLKEYSNRNEQEKVWRLLAAKFEATDPECKLRWRNIRSAFARYIRSKSTTGSGAKKPYYLWDHLQYLLPYTKSKTQSGNLGGVGGSSSHQETVTEESVDDPSCDQTAEGTTSTMNTKNNIQDENDVLPQPPTPSSTPSTSLSSWRSSKIQMKKNDPLEKAVISYFENKGKPQQTDPTTSADLNFLTSLLPDMTGLPPRKKRMFKRTVLEILDELSEDDFSSSSISGTISTTPTPPPQTPTPPISTSQLPRSFTPINAPAPVGFSLHSAPVAPSQCTAPVLSYHDDFIPEDQWNLSYDGTQSFHVMQPPNQR